LTICATPCLPEPHPLTRPAVLTASPHSYQTRLFSKSWLASKKLSSAIPEHLQKYAVLD
jgi:hypothetical protein